MIVGSLVGLLLVIAALHVYWALGGSVGKSVTVPESDGEPLFQPGPAGTMAVALGLVAFAGVVALHAGLIGTGSSGWTRYGTLAVAVVFGVRAFGDLRWVGFTKRRRGTRFALWDDLLFSPLCLLLALLALLVAKDG